MSNQNDFTFKIILCGDGGVGKTTILHRFIEGKFKIDTIMTIGVGFFHKPVDINDGKNYNLQLWDFGGQQHFRAILDSYASGAMGAILMVDMTRMSSVHKLDDWIDIPGIYTGTMCSAILMCGNLPFIETLFRPACLYLSRPSGLARAHCRNIAMLWAW